MPIAPTEAALETWLEQAANREKSGRYSDLKLEPIRAVLRHLPPVPRPVTLAGTKGKGSTTRLLEAILLAHGQRTVAFTSPHVRTVRERWRLDGRLATAGELAEAVAVVEDAEAEAGLRLTYFERGFALACVLAAGHGGEFLCEVGLGGRLDCANALDARLAICTRLDLDHVQVLGHTLGEIAGEKLAVARTDAPLLIGPQSEEGLAAVRSRLPQGVEVRFVAPCDPRDGWRPAMPGRHQFENLATAVAAARQLLGAGFSEALARQAAETTRLAGRCQAIALGAGRTALVDGAHTPDSVAATLATAAALLRPGWHLLVAMARDKQAEAICAAIAGSVPAARCHRCGYDSHRSRGSEDWPAGALGWSWHERLPLALATIPPEADVCITGSLYLAGEALAALAPDDDLPG